MTILMDKMTLLLDKMTLLPGGWLNCRADGSIAGQMKPPSPRWDGSEVPVSRVAVPKTGQKPPSPRGDATEMVVGGGAVPKTVQSIA